MKIGIVLSTNDPETVWNALRFGNASLLDGHDVGVFLLGKGVELGGIKDERFDIKRQVDLLVERDGKVMACGTCLTLRKMKGSETCPTSTMTDLLALVKGSDRVLTFG